MAEHKCTCQSAVRRLALVIGDAAADSDEFDELLRRFDMAWHADLKVAVVTVGPGATFAGAAEVSDLISGVLGRDALHRIKAAWLDAGEVEEQLVKLLRASSLADLAPAQDSPLATILDRRAIDTWFQPIFDRGGATWGFECLMRARDEAGDTISPAQLIAWARQDNLLFMLDRVCREVHIANADRVDDGEGYHFLINFLPSVIYRPEFCLRTTVAALKRTNLPPERICFEVVESESVTDHAHLREILAFYREAGFRVALDDVGSGYSGLSLLADLEPDLVKIDRSLVQRVLDSSAHADICRSIAELGRRQGKQVLAEGIETAEQCAHMLDMGVDLFQGFHLGRPAPR